MPCMSHSRVTFLAFPSQAPQSGARGEPWGGYTGPCYPLDLNRPCEDTVLLLRRKAFRPSSRRSLWALKSVCADSQPHFSGVCEARVEKVRGDLQASRL